MSGEVFIYALCEPDHPWNIRYVGKTVKPLSRRLVAHLATSKHLNTHKSNWLKSLAVHGLVPSIRLLDIGDCLTCDDLECFYIMAYKAAGFDLTNGTVGGDGVRPGSPGVGAKISAANKGRKAWNKGLTMPAHVGQAVSRAQKGRKQSAEAIAKRVASLKGKKFSTINHHNKRKTHCLQGHEYDDANTYVSPSGGRSCRTCRKAKRKQWDEAHRVVKAKTMRPRLDQTPVPCACGCGSLLVPVDSKGRLRRFIGGHRSRMAMKRAPTRGEAHYHAKLSADNVREIRLLAAQGLSQVEIGSTSTTSNLLARAVLSGVRTCAQLASGATHARET